MAHTMPPPFPTDLSNQPDNMASKVSEHASELKTKAADYGRKAADAIDEKREAAAGGFDRAAATLHDKAENLPGVEALSGFAHSAADKLSSTADYVREHDVRRVMTDIKAAVKRNPGPSLLVAAVAGFLLARKLSGGRN